MIKSSKVRKNWIIVNKRKIKKFYNAGVSASELIKKNIAGLIPRTNFHHYKLFNKKIKKKNGKHLLITNDIGTKIETLINEDDLLELKRN